MIDFEIERNLCPNKGYRGWRRQQCCKSYDCSRAKGENLFRKYRCPGAGTVDPAPSEIVQS